MKLFELLNLNAALKAIIDDAESKIDIALKFKLLGILKSFEPHVVNFDTIRNDKIKEYGTENDNGEISIPGDDKEALDKFSNELNELLNTDVTINIEKIKAKDAFNKGMKAEYLIGLYGIMEE